MQEASMKLTESLHEVYEPDWYGREDVKMVGEKCDVLWEDFHQKLVDGSLLTLDTYLGQFPDIKNRIAKRSRKLVDYDSARHHLEALQSSKRKDESRISKNEVLEVKKEETLLDLDFDPFKPDVAPAGSATATHSPMSQIPPGTDADETVGTTVPTAGVPVEEAEAEKAALPAAEADSMEGTKIDAESTEVKSSESPPPAETEAAATQEKVIPSVVIEPASNHEGEGEHHETTVGPETREASEVVAPRGQAGEMPELAAEATPLDSQAASPAAAGAVDSSLSAEDAAQEMPPGFLYKVETLHDFEAANSDELNLQRGDVVLVVPSDSEADQDAGWLVGVKESDWLQYRDLATYKGLFPENFTRRLE
ncbi:hypothetical protein NN561_015509 [Cricetulus griseus]